MQFERRFTLYPCSRIGTGDQALCTGFLVTGGAVDLPGKIKSLDKTGFQRRAQVARIEIVVFDGIARAGNLRLLETEHAVDHLLLHVEGQAGGNTVRVNLAQLQTFGFDKYLVRRLVGKPHDLVFD